MSCRGSPVPLCKSAGTKQLKVVHGASATCVLQNVDSGLSLSSDTTVPVYSGDRLALCVGEADRNLENDPTLRHLSHQWNQVFAEAFRSGSKTVNLTDRHDVNVLS